MKKGFKFALISMLLLSFVIVTACGSKNSGTAAAGGSAAPKSDGKTFTMKFATATTNDTQTNEMALYKKTLEEKSGGRIKVELYPSSQLGSNDQLLQMLTSGNIQAVVQPTAFLGGFNEMMTIVDIPYLWPDVQKATEYLNADGAKLFEPSLNKLGITALRYYEYGPRIILMKNKIEKISDFKGKKVRVMGAPVLVDEINAFGGAGVAMGVPELFTALQQGTIEGLESAANFFYSGKYHESAKYLLNEPKGAEVSIFMANSQWIKSLPEDLQKAVKDTAVEITDPANKFARESDAKAVDEMKKAGLTVLDASTELHQALVDASKPIIPKFEAKVAGSKEIIEKIQAKFKN